MEIWACRRRSSFQRRPSRRRRERWYVLVSRGIVWVVGGVGGGVEEGVCGERFSDVEK